MERQAPAGFQWGSRDEEAKNDFEHAGRKRPSYAHQPVVMSAEHARCADGTSVGYFLKMSVNITTAAGEK